MPGFTVNQWVILFLVLVLGWLLGLLSRTGSNWRRLYEEELALREAAEARAASSANRVVELERQLAEPRTVATTAAPASQPVGGSDDLSLIHGIGEDGERRLNALGYYRFRQIADLDAREEAELEAKMGIAPGTITQEEWRAQAQMLAGGDLAGHRTRYIL